MYTSHINQQTTQEVLHRGPSSPARKTSLASFTDSRLETVTKGSFRIDDRPTRSSAGSARALRRAAMRDLKKCTRTATARALLKARCQNSVVFKRTPCTHPSQSTVECTPPTCAEVTCIMAQLVPSAAWQGRRDAGEHRHSICYPDTCIWPCHVLLCMMACRTAHPLMRRLLGAEVDLHRRSAG